MMRLLKCIAIGVGTTLGMGATGMGAHLAVKYVDQNFGNAAAVALLLLIAGIFIGMALWFSSSDKK